MPMIRLSTRVLAGALAVITLALSGAPATAQAPLPASGVQAQPLADPQPDHPAYAGLIDAMNDAVDQEAAVDAMSVTIAREYAKVPQIAAMEQARPGLIDAIVRGMRPTLINYGTRVQADYRPRMRALLARYLTPAEAEDLIALYRSPIGLKLLGQASRSMTMDSTMSGIAEDIAAGKDPADVTVNRGQVASDIDKASRAAVGALSQDELMALGKLAMEKPAVMKLGAIRDEMLALRTQMENEQPTPAETTAIEQAVIGAMERHLGK
jgi:hypothetical protein